jgi:large subunit ribosomal protein L23
MSKIDLLKSQVLTEKTNNKLQKNIYVFDVDIKINKQSVKLLIQDVFNVKVISVNSYILSGQSIRLGKYLGFKNSYKRIFVKLEKGNIIPFFSGF